MGDPRPTQPPQQDSVGPPSPAGDVARATARSRRSGFAAEGDTRGIEHAPAPLQPTEGAPGEPAPTVARMPDVPGFAIAILAAIAGVWALQWSQVVLIPVVIGILIAYALEPFVSILARARLPRSVGAAIVITVFVAGLGLGMYALSGQALQVVRQVPEAAQRLRERLRDHGRAPGTIGEVQKAATELQKTAEVASQQSEPPATPRPPGGGAVQRVEIVEPAFDAKSYLYWGGMNLLALGGQFAVILFLVYFFLVTGDLYKRKIVKIAGPALWQKKLTVQILDEINGQISSFIRVQIFTSALVAAATMVALWAFGVKQFIIWGLLAGIFNSIPYIGPILVSGGLAIVAFMQFDDLGRAMTVAGVAFAITSLEGFLLTPALMSRAARMNPIAVFVGLLFFGWIWGIWGAILAVPMLMMLKAVCDHLDELQPIGELLGQ